MRSRFWLSCCSLLAACSADADSAPFDAGQRALDAEVAARTAPEPAPRDASTARDAAPKRDAAAPRAASPVRDAAPMNMDVDAGPAAIDPAAEAMHARADALLETLLLRFWGNLSANTNTYDWMYAHYWDAVLDAAERRGPSAFADTARMFFELQQKRGWLDGYYDDENWITLALLHAYAVTSEPRYLEQAKHVFADIELAWDDSCCGELKGGLFWKKPKENKVTAINAGAVISAARLYAYTHEARYLSFAQKAYDFWAKHMVDRASGHVYDGFDNAGVINKGWKFTYNEGLFIGAIVELSRVTGDTTQLALAHKVAGFVLREESAMTSLGSILSDGKCSGDGEMFKGVGARYLGELYALDPSHTEYRDFLRRSADAVWTLARDASSGLVSCDWAGPFDMAGAHVGALGSAAVATAAAAKALGPGEQRAPLRYEAEEGNLHGVGLEAKYAGFSGWGYIAGWGNDGQSVDLTVKVDTAATYMLQLRYASSGDAARTLELDGATLQALKLPDSGGYTTYRELQVDVKLAPGPHTITLALHSARGDTGYVNLDRLELTQR